MSADQVLTATQVSAAVSTWSALTTTAPHAIITMLGTIRFVLVNIFISCELIYVTDDYNACPFLLINLSGAKTVFAAIANSSVVAAVSLTNKFLEKPGDQCSDKERSPTEHSFQDFVIK